MTELQIAESYGEADKRPVGGKLVSIYVSIYTLMRADAARGLSPEAESLSEKEGQLAILPSKCGEQSDWPSACFTRFT